MTRTRFYINDQIYLFYEYNPCRSFPYMEGMGSSKNLCNDVHKLVFFHTFPYKECVIFHLSIDGNLLCSDGHMEEFLYIFSDRYIYPFCNTQFLFCDDIVWEQCLSKLCKCNHHNFGHIARYKDGHIGVLWHNQSGMTLMKDLYNKVSLLHVHKSDAFSSLLSYNHRILCNIFWTNMSTITDLQAWPLTWKVVNRFIAVTSSVTVVPTLQFCYTWLNTPAV